jgi:glyoxylase-like metal-dependent hydrolase (beta-lactamase superfamily II)
VGSIDFGDVTVTRVFEWQDHLITRAQLVPDSELADWEANKSWLTPEFWSPETDEAWLCAQTFVVKSGGRTILIDTGIGNGKSRPHVPPFDGIQTPFLASLTEAAGDPADVDLVVCTHLHGDHVGWNTQLENGEWAPTFPNATYLFPQADFDYWNPEDQDPPGGPMNVEVFNDSVLPIVHAGQAQFFTGEHIIDEHLKLTPAPGHSPGSSVVELNAGGELAIFAGDLLHTPMQVLRPTQGACFDDNPGVAVSARDRILAQAADTRAAFIAGHFNIERAARIARRGESYVIDSWIPFT